MLTWRTLAWFAVLTVLVVPLLPLPGAPLPRAGADPVAPSLPGAPTTTPTATIRPLAPDGALLAKAAQAGTVRVLVTVRAAFQPEGLLAVPAQQTQRAGISQAQGRVLAAATAQGGRTIAQYRTIPVVALAVNQTSLQALSRSSDVLAVQEDIPQPPLDTASNNVIGVPTAISLGFDGTGYAVAILDTGVQTDHPFLTPRVIAEACFSTTDAAQGSTTVCPNHQSTSGTTPGQAGIGSGANCDPSIGGCFHGTHVAGIAAGLNYAGGPGFDGVARGAKIVALQVFSRFTDPVCSSLGTTSPCALSYTTDQLAALDYVYTTVGGLIAPIKVASANMSLGGGSFSSNCDATETARKAAIDNLRSIDVATVIATGNSGSDGSISTPACISTAVSVGATDNGDAVASFSNTANFMSLFAPGVSVTSSVPTSAFGIASGTSMSTPHVAGAWAVMKQHHPSGTVADLLSVLQSTGVGINAGRTLTTATIPRLNLGAASVPGDLTVTPSTALAGATGQSFTFTYTAMGGGLTKGRWTSRCRPVGAVAAPRPAWEPRVWPPACSRSPALPWPAAP